MSTVFLTKHPDTSFHIHNYTTRTKRKKKTKKKQPFRSFSQMHGMKGTRWAAKPLQSVLLCSFLFNGYLHYFLHDGSSDTAAAENARQISATTPAFYGWSKVLKWSKIHTASYLYLHIYSALTWIINATRSLVRKRNQVKREGDEGNGKAASTHCKGNVRERDCVRLGASIKYFNLRLSCCEEAFDPDSKGLLQNKHFFELAAAQWDSPRERVQKKYSGKKKKKLLFSLSGFPPCELSLLCCKHLFFIFYLGMKTRLLKMKNNRVWIFHVYSVLLTCKFFEDTI